MVALFGTPGRDYQASVHRCKQCPRSSAAVGFVFGLIGFVFDLVKSPIATRSCSNINSLLTLRLEQVFPSLASFGALHAAPDCQMPPSRSGFSLTISKGPTTTVGRPNNGKLRDAFLLGPARATPLTFPLYKYGQVFRPRLLPCGIFLSSKKRKRKQEKELTSVFVLHIYMKGGTLQYELKNAGKAGATHSGLQE
jgi:hypothetical protein